MNGNILCSFPYDTFELFFSSRGLSNLPSEIQGAQAWDISVPKESLSTQKCIYEYPCGAQAGRSPCWASNASYSVPLRVSNIYFPRSLSQLLVDMSEGLPFPTKGSEPQSESFNPAFRAGLYLLHILLGPPLFKTEFGPRPKRHLTTLLTSVPGRTQTILQDK